MRSKVIDLKERRLQMQTRRVLATLTPREEQILRMLQGVGWNRPCTHEEIGREFGLTAECVRQIEAKVCAKLTSYRL